MSENIKRNNTSCDIQTSDIPMARNSTLSFSCAISIEARESSRRKLSKNVRAAGKIKKKFSFNPILETMTIL